MVARIRHTVMQKFYEHKVAETDLRLLCGTSKLRILHAVCLVFKAIWAMHGALAGLEAQRTSIAVRGESSLAKLCGVRVNP